MNETTLPWYRVPMVWLLIALPLTAVIAGLATLWIAASTDDGVVADDYYRRGKEINRELRRDQAAAALGLKARLRLDTARNELHIELVAKEPLPAQLEAQFLHTTRGHNDRRLLLARGADGAYRAPIPELAPGRYHIQLAADDWRIVGSLRAPEEADAKIVPVTTR